MTLKEIAYRNLVRRKAKAAFVLAGLVIGVATVVGIITFLEAMTEDINHKLEQYGANILIVPRTENLTLSYGGMSLGGVSFEVGEIKEADLERVHTIKNARNISVLGPLVLGVLNIGNRKVLLAGVDLQAATLLKPWWQINGKLPDENSVLLGAEAARVLKLNTGNRVVVKDKNLSVSGVLHSTGSQDDHLVFARLKTAQTILNKEGRISMAEVAALCKDCPINDMVSQISNALPAAKVMAIQQVVKGRMETLAQFKKFSIGISGVILLIGSMVVLVTMMSSVRERTEEIGIFRAVGFRRSHVTKIVFLEAGALSCLAGITGYLIGIGAARLALQYFTESGAVHMPVRIELAGAALLLAVLIGIGSSIYPALMASRMDPNEALRAL